MTTPLQKSLLLAVFSLITLAGMDAFADIAAVKRAAGCTGAGASSARCRSIDSSFSGTHAASCNARREAAQDCCGSWSASSLCLQRLDPRSRTNIEEFQRAAAAANGGTVPNTAGLFGAASADQEKNRQGRDAFQAMEGVCRGMRQACEDGCGASAPAPTPPTGTTAGTWNPGSAAPSPTGFTLDNASNGRFCKDGLNSFAEGFKQQSEGFQTAMDQDEEARRRAASNNGPGGNNPGGNNGGGTQQPQSAGKQDGKGQQNPMADLMKGLAGLMKPEQKPEEQPQQPPAIDCSNPALAGGNCPPAAVAAESDSWNKKAGEAEMKEAEASPDAGKFNVAGNEAGDTSYNGNGEKKFSTPPTVTPVGGGGGGGGMPGSGGGAQASPGGGAAGYAGPKGNIADVIHGLGGGGGYAATNAAMQLQNGSSSGGYTYGQGGAGDQMRGMDLRQFLPGGKSDPTRKLAGATGLGGTGMQIQSQSVNIWNRITERIKSRCSQGLLRDCVP